MPWIPMTGFGATLTVGGNTLLLRSASLSFETGTLDATNLQSIYVTKYPTFISGSFSATATADGNVADALLLMYAGRTTQQAAVACAFSDSASANAFTFSALLTRCGYDLSGDDVDVIQIEGNITGMITAV